LAATHWLLASYTDNFKRDFLKALENLLGIYTPAWYLAAILDNLNTHNLGTNCNHPKLWMIDT